MPVGMDESKKERPFCHHTPVPTNARTSAGMTARTVAPAAKSNPICRPHARLARREYEIGSRESSAISGTHRQRRSLRRNRRSPQRIYHLLRRRDPGDRVPQPVRIIMAVRTKNASVLPACASLIRANRSRSLSMNLVRLSKWMNGLTTNLRRHQLRVNRPPQRAWPVQSQNATVATCRSPRGSCRRSTRRGTRRRQSSASPWLRQPARCRHVPRH